MNKSNKNVVINYINIALVLVLILTLVASVNCYITQYEKIYRTNELTAKLEEEINNGEKLRIEYEKRTNIREVEDYAVNVLGLQKYSNYQVEYITKQNSNKTVMFEQEAPTESVLSRVATVFSIIAEYFD
ncbi:MAG: hypothetical protein IJN12_01740 [Clostridia bacterium]|nr:hypothetical protein [Clostridia bacterium]